MTTTDQYLTLAEDYIQDTPLSALWAEQVRKNAMDSFKKNGFPGKSENYRFTNIEKFLASGNWKAPHKDYDNRVIAEIVNYQSHYENLVVFVNGILATELSRHPSIEVKPTYSSLDNEETLWKSFTNFASDELTSLHHSFLYEGVIIKASKNTKSTLKVLSLITDENLFSHPTLLVKAEKFSELTLIEECHAVCDKTYAQQVFALIHVEAGAKVEHIQLVHENNSTHYLNTTEAKVQKDAIYRNITLHLGAAMARKNLAIELLEAGAHAESFALYGLKGKQHSDISTQILHKAADTTSAQIAKGILADESRGVFTGKIHIFAEAQRVNSSQLNKNLLLSNKAQAHSQPQLEIFADDVKCSHGSTTGQLQDDELFYFQSRGIPEDKARTLLAHAFGNEILMKIENKVIREEINDRVLKEFESHLGH
ncbi:MAG: Fe-S cluster assembly protein SufD [Bacteriovoracaceae bacterium]